MARILIDARAIADPYSGGVGRAARTWIKHVTCSAQLPSAILSEASSASVIERSGPYIKPDSSTSLRSAQNDKLSICQDNDLFCVTTGWRPSLAVQKFCNENSLRYLHLRVPNKLWTLACLLRLTSLSRQAEKRVGPIDCLLLPNLAFTGELHRPYILLLHDCTFAIEPHWFNWRRQLWHRMLPIKELIERAAHIDAVSRQTKDDALRLFRLDSDRVRVLPPMTSGLEPGETVRPSWLPKNIRRYALLLGGADPRKNVHTALRAVSTFNIQHPALAITPIVLGGKVHSWHGTCPLAYLQAPKKVGDDDLRFLYQNATALLYPSWYEGFGLPLHEAHQYGTPIVASTAGALPETAPPGTLFCHPAKPQEWVTALESL